MPVHKKKAPARHSHPELVKQIADELARDSTTGPPGAPQVFQQEQAYGNYLHVTVIWEQWAGVPMEKRGAIIGDAYETAGLQDVLSRITRILGLTEEEAKKLKVDY